MHKIIGLVFLVCSLSTFASKEQVSDIRQDLTVVGKARFSVLFWDIYDSALFSSSGKYQTNENFLFEITYLRDIEGEELLQRTIEQWQHIGIDAEIYQTYVNQLERLWPDIKAGDQLSLWVTPSESIFFYNQNYLGTIDGNSFGETFTAIWLSPKTSQPKLRKKLLGLRGK